MDNLNLELDQDGYPTEDSLDTIELYPIVGKQGAIGFIEAIQQIWWMSDWGFIWDGKKKLILHTGGWSGNESIIHAMQKNSIWFYWRASFAGGHYHFELPQ